ncbi:MAG: TlpA family protein disulfide reductase [Acidobacteriia bacterium]|nr:TlpA family protein disulfide reductase [Terriglobia bacterium]
MTRRRSVALSLGVTFLLTLVSSPPAAAQQDAETRVLDYIREHLRPGEPFLVTDLYNNVFTQPEERKALDKLYNALFRIPRFAVEYQEHFSRLPSLKIIAEQFDLRTPEAADILLRVLEADPRVPNFLTRDPKTHEITQIDKARVLQDPRFAHAVARQLSGWEGKPAPVFQMMTLDGKELDSESLRGRPVLLYVWFTGCPPCMEEAPQLVALDHEFSGRGLTIVGANADSILGLGYDDAARRRYVETEKIPFTITNWTRESDAAYGGIAIFPALFLIDAKGVIIRHWVGYVSGDVLRQAVAGLFAEPTPSK